MRMKKFSALALVLLLCLVMCACSSGEAGGSVTIASKQYTESILLAEMYAQLVESHTDLDVIRKLNLGTTAVCFEAMQRGEVDFFVEYTGTACREILLHEHENNRAPEESLDEIKKEMDELFGVTVFEAIGLSNNYAIGMLSAKAESLGIKTMSDLGAASSKLIFSANDLFFTRIGDGYDDMTELYNMSFKSVVKMSNVSSYAAIVNDQVDVMLVYTTDSLLQSCDMLILEDDQSFFPEYNAIPIARNDVLKKYPQLAEVFDLLANCIDNERMQELNHMVDIGGKIHEDVAGEFLESLGLLNR